MPYRTDQEEFWAGDFGVEYIERNKGPRLLASNLNFFSHALRRVRELSSCIEFGANVGMNLKALKLLYPDIRLSAVEINKMAAQELEEVIGASAVHQCSILDYHLEERFTLSLVKGVLIHISPKYLSEVYRRLYESSSRYILICEYYNPSPVTLTYRGHGDRLFKRDFAGELMEAYDDVHLVDYGFAYRHDPVFPQDDVTWFLMEKQA